MTHLNFQSIFSGPENVLWFVLGVISVQVWQWIKAKYKDYKDPGHSPHLFKQVNWLYVVIALTWLLSIFIGVDNQQTYTFAEKLARDTQQCQVEFNKALIANREVNTQDRNLMVEWARISFVRAQQLSYLSRVYGATSDTYLEQKAQVDAVFFQEVQRIEQERIRNEEERAKVPYPEPSCGREVKK